MRFSFATALAGLASLAAAQDPTFDAIYTPTAGQEVPAGVPFTITWDAKPDQYDNELIKIHLIGGATQNVQVPLYEIVAGIPNGVGKYEWTPKKEEFGKNFYGLVIALQSNAATFQYSNPFKLVAGPSSGSSSTTTTTSTPSSSPTSSPTKSLTKGLYEHPTEAPKPGHFGSGPKPSNNGPNPPMEGPKPHSGPKSPNEGGHYPTGKPEEEHDEVHSEDEDCDDDEGHYPEEGEHPAPSCPGEEICNPEHPTSPEVPAQPEQPEATSPEVASPEVPVHAYPEVASPEVPAHKYPEVAIPEVPAYEYPEVASPEVLVHTEQPEVTSPEVASPEVPAHGYAEFPSADVPASHEVAETPYLSTKTPAPYVPSGPGHHSNVTTLTPVKPTGLETSPTQAVIAGAGTKSVPVFALGAVAVAAFLL